MKAKLNKVIGMHSGLPCRVYVVFFFGSINHKLAHPPRQLLGIFSLLRPHSGALGEGQLGGGTLSKRKLGLSDNNSSIWFHSSMWKYLHNCFHLQTRNDRKKNVHCT